MKLIGLVCVALAAGSLAVAGQTPAPPQSAPLFRTGVEYVSVDVVVTDKNDKPVTDLRKDEFVVTESKQPQTIRDFQFVSIPVVTRDIEVNRPEPPVPDVATNMPPSPKSRLFAIIIDDLHIIEQDLMPLRAALTDLVRSLSPDDEVAVVFVGRSDLSQNFTTDVGLIMKPIEHLRDALGFGEDAMGVANPATSAKIGALSLNLGRSAVFVLNNVAASLVGSGHTRRAIFFVSGGFAIDRQPGTPDYVNYLTMRDELDAAYATAARADVPIYSIDPRGLITAANSVRGCCPPDPVVLAKVRTQQDYLAEASINTGGRVLMNRSNLTKAIQEVIQENGSYYLLGYTPEPSVRDGKFHEISVKVTRPGLIVRPRKGYMASSSAPSSDDAKPALDKAMSAGVNVAGIALRATAAPIAATAAGVSTAVMVDVSYPAPTDGSSSVGDTLEMSLVALDPDGKIKAKAARTVHFNSTLADGAAAVSILIDNAITLPSQPLTLRIGIASQGLGRAGTIQLKVDVPKPGDSKLQLGGVAIGYADFLREAALQRETIAQIVPFQPTVSRSFAATDTIRVFSRLFWGPKDPVEVTVSIVGATGRAPQTLKVDGAASPINPSKREGVIDVRVPMAGLAAGSYVIRLQAKLPNGQVARRDVPMEVK